MRSFTRLLALPILLAAVPAGAGRAADIGWPEAVSRLAAERSKAETCLGSLKGQADDRQIQRGRLVYGSAKADYDGVIAGLIAVLAEAGTPVSLPDLEAKLGRGASGLGEFCRMAADLVSAEGGQKGILDDIVKAAVEPVVKALSEGVAALYNNRRHDDALTRQTIQTQLEAARWPDFGAVEAQR